MARQLNVYLHQHLVGTLVQDNHGETIYQYNKSWLESPNSLPLSQSLPLRTDPFLRRECHGFFGGILPEGEKREIVARNLGITAKNDVKMLEQIGGECAGAVTFLSDGDSLPVPGNQYLPLTDQMLADILRELPKRPLLAGREHVRLSLAGAQDKLAVHVADGQISLPLDGAPSTHILKPRIERFEGIVANESLCMNLAKAIGLSTPSVQIGYVEETEYLLVERYDRIRGEEQPLERLHQEDFCQALGIASENKYQNEGGPTLKQCFQLLRDASSIPVLDVLRLLDAVIFNFLIGNNDAHGKNFSLLYQKNNTQSWTTSLAPLYDLICTTYYRELSSNMAMKIGREYESTKVSLLHFDIFAEEARLNKPQVRRRIQSLARLILSALPSVTPEHQVGQAVAQIIRNRCSRTIEMFKPVSG